MNEEKTQTRDPDNPVNYRKQDFLAGAFKRDTLDDDEGLGDIARPLYPSRALQRESDCL